MKVEYSEDRKTAFFDGVKFRRDAKTGYYLAARPTYQGKRERLHVYVWRYFNGPIKDGYHVHHKDESKGNNDIENLSCIPETLHERHHGCSRAANHYEELCKNLAEKAQPKAAEWHRSESGIEWHSKHAIEAWESMEPIEYVCTYCGKKFLTKKRYSDRSNTFCSNNCKAAARRKSGVDDEKRVCAFCGKEFVVNKYAKTKCCSRACARSLYTAGQRKTAGQSASL